MNFTACPDCDNCHGTGIFAEATPEQIEEPCIFCLESAILSGEIDGEVGGISYRGGLVVIAEAGCST